MLTMNDEDFAQNQRLLFEEVVRRGEDALIEVGRLGCFRLSYESSKADSGKRRGNEPNK